MDKEALKKAPFGVDYDGNPIYLSDDDQGEDDAMLAGIFDNVMLTEDDEEVIKGEKFNTFHPIKNGQPDFSITYQAEDIGFEGLFEKESW